MKITSPALNSPIAGTRSDSTAALGASNSGTTAPSAATRGATAGSSVGLSAAARHLSSLENSDNDIDMERVNQIRDAIASGQLKMDASRIADGLIASVRDLLK